MDCAEHSLPQSSVAADCDWDCETSQITTLAALLMFGKSSAAALLLLLPVMTLYDSDHCYVCCCSFSASASASCSCCDNGASGVAAADSGALVLRPCVRFQVAAHLSV